MRLTSIVDASLHSQRQKAIDKIHVLTYGREEASRGPSFAHRGDTMSETLYPSSTGALAEAHKRLAPEQHDAFQTFSRKVFADGALATKTKQLIAVAVAHVTQCPYCIRGHTKAAMREGATREELMEAIWVAAEMRAGAAYAHSALALDEMKKATPSLVSDDAIIHVDGTSARSHV
jgi:AhpD family alkylhydroperoxidase